MTIFSLSYLAVAGLLVIFIMGLRKNWTAVTLLLVGEFLLVLLLVGKVF